LPWDNIKEIFTGLHTTRLCRYSLRSLDGFGIVMIHAFNLCLAPALGGLFVARAATKRYLALLAVGIPALLTYTYFDLGSSFYIQFPRLVYQCYPLVYVLCGLCLARLSESRFAVSWPHIGMWTAFFVVTLHFVWVNADVFGHPAIYYYWFYRYKAFA
jgi:hypothetical protein